MQFSEISSDASDFIPKKSRNMRPFYPLKPAMNETMGNMRLKFETKKAAAIRAHLIL